MKIEILIFDGGSKKYQETPPPKLRTANMLAITRARADPNFARRRAALPSCRVDCPVSKKDYMKIPISQIPYKLIVDLNQISFAKLDIISMSDLLISCCQIFLINLL